MSAANMTYDSLVEDVIKYAERNDESFVTQIPRLIMLTEQSIAAEIKTLLQLNVVNTTIASGDSTVESRFVGARRSA